MIIGIDPGLTGGIAFLNDNDDLIFEPMPVENGVDPKALMRIIYSFRNSASAYIEKAQPMPGQGVTSMFNYGKGYGIVIGVLASIGIPINEIRPQQWQASAYTCCPKEYEGKDRSLWAFQKYWPDRPFPKVSHRATNAHLGMVEAALIAEYGRRQE